MTQSLAGSAPTEPSREGGASPGGPFRIQTAARLSGVPAATLRAWERRYGVPVPRRTASAYRLYSADDVELIRRMRVLVDDGTSPAEAATAVLLDAPLAPAGARVDQSAEDGLVLAQNRILAATHRWDSAAIDSELTRLSMLLDAQSLYERVVSPLLVEVGARWERGELGVAQEHLLTERLELAVRASLRTLERPDGPLILLACVDFEQHVLGLLGAALRFAACGTRTVVLGAMTPATALREAVKSMVPRVVGLSTSVTPPGGRAFYKAYGKACGGVPWVVGGAAAEAQRSAIEAAGGIVASGPSSAWNGHIREWLQVHR